MPISGYQAHFAGSGHLEQNSWICRFAEALLAHPEIPIARVLDQLHPGFASSLNTPIKTLLLVLQLLIHSFACAYGVCHLARLKLKVPAIRQTSSKVLKKYMVTCRMKKIHT